MAAANTNLPPPFFDRDTLISFFGKKGFTPRELVILSGGHTIGKARCATFMGQINDPDINKEFATEKNNTCKISNGNLADLDSSATVFDNKYFEDLKAQKGLLRSDRQLYGGETQTFVEEYIENQRLFYANFGEAMIKMGQLSPATGSVGEIRTDCRRPN